MRGIPVLLLFFLIVLVDRGSTAPTGTDGDATVAEEPVERVFFLDFSDGGRAETNGRPPEIVLVEPNRQGGGKSVVFPAPGASRIAWEFDLPAVPTSAALELEHLSSSARGRLGGISVISLAINGESVLSRWDVGTHVMAIDRIQVGKFLVRGTNTITIRFEEGPTCYWLRRVAVPCLFPPGTDFADFATERIPAGKMSDYAVVVGREVYATPAWRKVVETLAARHDAAVIVYPCDVSGAADELAALFPRYACFVTLPAGAGRRFVTRVHRMTRALDDDPYGDLLWGIVTGHTAEAALRLARETPPLEVRRVAAGCNIELELFVEGRTFSETEQGVGHVRRPGEKPEMVKCPPDATEEIVRTLNEGRVDCFVTSGHATDRDWQIGYDFESGSFLCEKGRLFGRDGAGRRFDIDSPNPKVYCPGGNCLIGRIENADAIALAWLDGGGARQMFGYTVSTWYGYGGWGVFDYFARLQGQHTLSESFFLGNQALLERLRREYPGSLGRNISCYDIEEDENVIPRIAMELQVRSRDELGLQWDRDTVAFYGDPAWQARVAPACTPAYEGTLTCEEGAAGRVRFTFRVAVNRDGALRRPPAALLPCRVTDIVVEKATKGLEPVVADNFVLLPAGGTYSEGDVLETVFSGLAISSSPAKSSR